MQLAQSAALPASDAALGADSAAVADVVVYYLTLAIEWCE